MSFFPPHLINSKGSLTPAALIPFCSFQGDMNVLGENEMGLNFTACSKFKPTMLEGQLCYALNLSLIEKDKTKAGENEGLVLIIDNGFENTQMKQPEVQHEKQKNPLVLGSSAVEDSSSRIYLNTLSSFSGFSGGSYAMTALKKMTGTTSFLKQTNEEKGCRIQTNEDCQAKRYIERVQKMCGCVPWALSSTMALKV